MTRLDELEARLDALTTAILLPLRADKRLNDEALDSLNKLVKELVAQVGDAQVVPRRLTGKLWFVFTQMLAEADHTRSPEAILYRAWSYEEELEKLFGPWFGDGPPNPGAPHD